MQRSLYLLMLCFSLAACDPSFTATVRVLVTDPTDVGGKPISDATIVTRFSTSEKPSHTDTTGAASLTMGGFLKYPEGPLIIYKEGYRLWYGERDNGYTLVRRRHKLRDQNEYFHVDLAVSLLKETGGVGLSMDCDANRACSVLLPLSYGEAIVGELFVVEEGHAYLTSLSDGAAPLPTPVGQGGGKLSFTLPDSIAPGAKVFGLFRYLPLDPKATNTSFCLVSDPVIVSGTQQNTQ